MPAQYGTTSITATGRYSIKVDKSGGPGDNLGTLAIGAGTFTVTSTLQGNPFTAIQDPTGAGWADIEAQNMTTGAFGAATLTTNTAGTWQFNAEPFQQVAMNVTALTGAIPFNLLTYVAPTPYGQVAGTTTITSTSASALAVGANGSTNPVLQVDDSTASVATGIKIKGAAAASGAAVSVISSGTNENLTIDAKGSGTVTINATGTGNVVIGANLGITDAKNVVLGTTTGTKIGTATTQKLGFFNATPVVQPIASTDATTGAAGGTTSIYLNTTFTGAGGTAAYTVGGVVTALKALGLLAP